MEVCAICKKSLTILHAKYKCMICGSTICRECREKWYEDVEILSHIYNAEIRGIIGLKFLFGYLPICKHCFPQMKHIKSCLRDARNKHVEIVYSNYRGHKSYKTSGQFMQSRFWRNKEDAIKELQTIVAYKGYDMVINVKYEKDVKAETSDSGKGVHKYTVWRCSGIPVKQ